MKLLCCPVQKSSLGQKVQGAGTGSSSHRQRLLGPSWLLHVLGDASCQLMLLLWCRKLPERNYNLLCLETKNVSAFASRAALLLQSVSHLQQWSLTLLPSRRSSDWLLTLGVVHQQPLPDPSKPESTALTSKGYSAREDLSHTCPSLPSRSLQFFLCISAHPRTRMKYTFFFKASLHNYLTFRDVFVHSYKTILLETLNSPLVDLVDHSFFEVI